MTPRAGGAAARPAPNAVRDHVTVHEVDDEPSLYLDAAVGDALRAISHTLTERLSATLDERDSLAVASALRAAAAAGVRLGVAEMTASLIERGHDVHVELVLDEDDPFSERYGG
jgi:hypothetical protein